MNAFLYETARRLIAFDTVSSRSNIEAAEFLADRLESAGLTVVLQRLEILGEAHANVIGWSGPARADGLVVSGHIDTVPFAGQPGWTRDPLKLETEGERIYGRGVSDTKGFLAQCVDAARMLNARTLQRPVVFVFTAGEEVGCLGARMAAAELGALLGEVPLPRFAWIGEPTSFHICHAHKSIVLFNLTVRGRGGHSAAPASGVNAIAVMAKALEAVGRYQAERAAAPDPKFAAVFPETPCDVLNVGTIAGGVAANMIAEECAAQISCRSLPDADPLAMYREIRRRLERIDRHDFALGSHRAQLAVGPPLVVPPLDSPRGTRLERVLFEVTGESSSRGAPFATDGGWLARCGVVPLICGPGDFDQAHQPNESIPRDRFERGSGMILQVIGRMCGTQAAD